MIRKYQRTCPFCHQLCQGFEGNNLFCGCNSKFYWYYKLWLNRNTGEEKKESEKEDEQRKTD